MGRKKPNKYIELQKRLKDNHIDYQDLVDRRREEVEEIVIQKNRDFRTKNILAKAKDIKKEKQIISNKSFKSIYAGFINSENKDKYIEKNRNHIKGLKINEQRNLVRMFLQFI